jgi:glycosyltransferase involved in cell wall biosynthesis
MPTVHILSQYIWPDAAPTGLYAEQLATRLHEQGCNVRLIGGTGNYRPLYRDKPPVPVLHVDHYRGRRHSLTQTLIEYASVKRVFKNYIKQFVWRGDVVIVTSAPPNTVDLADCIKHRGAHAIYWLQDYYPELIRGIHEYPLACRRAFSRYWDRQLLTWDRVVKIGANLAGPEENAVVIRNWPTFAFENVTEPEPRTALYSGNLGYGHDIALLVAACEKLRDQGYRITIRADGRGVGSLPSWLESQPLHSDLRELMNDLVRHEVHLVAAHPKITRAVFPSKIWNSIALGRRPICTGFAGEMANELVEAKKAPFERHLGQWMQLLLSPENCEEAMPLSQVALALA